MAAKSKFLFTLFILLLLQKNSSGQQNNTVSNTGSTSSCICDLVVNGCDPNCCCDEDCSTTDKEAFTECKETKNVIYDDKVCVSDQMIFIQNVQFKTENTGDGLFCIIQNNNKNQKQYSSVSAVSDDVDFINIVNSRNVYSYNIQEQATEAQDTTNYKVGSPILLLLTNQVKGYLSLPTMFGSSSCNDLNAAGYLQDQVSECVRSFTDLSKGCSEMAVLSARNYYTGFDVVKTPQLYLTPTSLNSTSNATTSAVNGSFLFTPSLSTPLLCRDNSGTLDICPFSVPPDPSYNATTNTCDNVVTEVLYKFVYSNESTNLEQLNVSFVFGNTQGDFVQKHSVAFLKQGIEETFTKSGNPGYLTDQPLLAGLLLTEAATNKKAVRLSTNKKDWLTIMRPSLDGSCTNSINDRLSVSFNIDTRSGCFVRFNETTNCALLQDLIFSALLGANPPDYVASFGNSDVRNAGDWVKIINDKPANTASGGNGVCNNIVLGMHIEVLFAKIGYLINPQSKIVGVRFKFEQPKPITYQCIGQFCQNSASQSFEVVSSVAFIDVSQHPVRDYKAIPEFQSKAPSDFFHPFL